MNDDNKHTKTSVVEGVGVAVYDRDQDHIDLEGVPCHLGARSLFEAAGAEILQYGAESAFLYERHECAYYRILAGRMIAAYRSSTGRQYPRVYRVKITTTLEELPDDEAEAWWKKRQRGGSNDG